MKTKIFEELKELIFNNNIKDKEKTVFLDYIFYQDPTMFLEDLKNKTIKSNNLLHIAAEKNLTLTVRSLLNYAKLVFNYNETELSSSEIEFSSDEMDLSSDEMDLSSDEMDLSSDEMNSSSSETELSSSETGSSSEDVEFSSTETELSSDETQHLPHQTQILFNEERYEYDETGFLLHREIEGSKKNLSNVNNFFRHFINKQNNHLLSPLHLAVKANCFDSVSELLAQGANPNLQDSIGYTPLHWSVAKNHQDITLELIKYGAKTNITSFNLDNMVFKLCRKLFGSFILAIPVEVAPFNIAFLMKNILIADRLIDNIGSEDLSTSIYTCLVLKQDEICLKLLKKDVENKFEFQLLSFRDQLHNDLLSFACLRSSDPLIVEILINKRFDVNSKNKHGWSPLHNAVQSDKILNIIKLLEAGANLNVRDSIRKTPLHFAASKGNKDILKILLDAGADINARDAQGNTALHLAVTHNVVASLEILLERNPKINVSNKQGKTVVDLAYEGGNLLIMQNIVNFQEKHFAQTELQKVTPAFLPPQNNIYKTSGKKRDFDMTF